MKQNFYFKFVFLSLLMMVMGLGNAFAEDTWVKTDPKDLKTGDVVMIIDLDSKSAMSNNKGTSSAPVATRVYFNNEETVSTGISNNTVPATLQWKVTVDNDSYRFGVSGTSNYLYCTNSNDGVRVGTNSNNAFTIIKSNGKNYLKHTGTSRYLGVYIGQDWRCYTTTTSNNKETITTFFKKVSDDAVLSSISISGYTTTFNVGDKFTFGGTVTATYDKGETKDVTNSASFSGYDMSTPGTQTVTVSYGEKTATYDITVSAVPVAGITLNESVKTLHIGETLQLTAAIEPANATNKAYSWSTSDKSIATVNENGLVTALSEGSASITAIADDNEAITATCNITVEPIEGDWYSMVTTTDDLAEGDKVIIVNTENKWAMSTTQNSNNRDAINVTISDEKVFVPGDGGVQVFTLEGDAEGWYFNTGGGYIYAASSTKNYLKTRASKDDDNAKAKIEISNGATSVVFQGENTHNVLQNNGIIFSCYSSASQKPVNIYKLDDGKPKPTVSFADPVVEITYGDNYDKQKATAEGFSGNLVYTSSDENVVKFHGNSVIDVLKPGTVTITATAPATETTKESSATYTLKIYEPADAVEGQTELLNEKFDDCKGDEPKDGFGGNSSGFTDVPTSLAEDGWELTRCQAGDGYLKVSSSDNGVVVTPVIDLNGASEFSFEIAPWVSETANVTISLENATFEDGTTTSLTFNDLEQSTWKTKTFSIIGNGNVRVRIEATRRVFIDNFVVGGGAQPAHEINLKFSSAGYLTWVATADIDFAQTEGVTAYKITEAMPKKITMVEVDKVKAGKAVMLKGSGTVQLTRTTGAEAFTDNKMQACTDGSVTGNGVDGVTNTDVYVLGNGKNGLGFYMLKGTLQAGKGYLSVTEEAGNAKQSFIGFEVVTGVNAVEIKDADDAAIYNLQGIRVAHPQKGIYVKNGKKYVK